VIVVDASVLANALVYADDRGRKARSVLARDPEWAAPEHWKADVFSVIRGLTLGSKIEETVALHAVDLLAHLGMDHVSLDALLPRMWQFGTNISGYDSAYVALAEARGLTLTTSDARLARTAITYCSIELVAPGLLT
jgi:predicted nucleic acid-binding protein